MTWSATLTVPATTRSLRLISRFVLGNASIAGLPASLHNSFDLVAEEASTNVIRHAYKNDGSRRFTVTCSFDESQFCVQVADKGASFRLKDVPLPDITSDIERREAGGLGIYFMRSFMDKVEQKHDPDGTNRLILIKQKPWKEGPVRPDGAA